MSFSRARGFRSDQQDFLFLFLLALARAYAGITIILIHQAAYQILECFPPLGIGLCSHNKSVVESTIPENKHIQ